MTDRAPVLKANLQLFFAGVAGGGLGGCSCEQQEANRAIYEWASWAMDSFHYNSISQSAVGLNLYSLFFEITISCLNEILTVKYSNLCIIFVFHRFRLVLLVVWHKDTLFIQLCRLPCAPQRNAVSKRQKSMFPLPGSRFLWNLRILLHWCWYLVIFRAVGEIHDSFIDCLCKHLCHVTSTSAVSLACISLFALLESFTHVVIPLMFSTMCRYAEINVCCVCCASQGSTLGLLTQELLALIFKTVSNWDWRIAS